MVLQRSPLLSTWDRRSVGALQWVLGCEESFSQAVDLLMVQILNRKLP